MPLPEDSQTSNPADSSTSDSPKRTEGIQPHNGKQIIVFGLASVFGWLFVYLSLLMEDSGYGAVAGLIFYLFIFGTVVSGPIAVGSGFAELDAMKRGTKDVNGKALVEAGIFLGVLGIVGPIIALLGFCFSTVISIFHGGFQVLR